MNTVREIQNYFPNVSSEKAKIIDQNIKKSIADDDSYDSIKIYVQRELRGKKVKKKVSFWAACTAIAEQYFKNNRNWMSQENLFCFLALLVAIISMLFVFMEQLTGNIIWRSNGLQCLPYFMALVLFKLVEIKGWVYKNKRFNKFLEILNRNAPLLIIVCSMLFYLLVIIPCESFIRYVGMAFLQFYQYLQYLKP